MDDKTTILLNYEKVNSIAESLISIAGRLDKLNRTEFEEALMGINESWKGENAELFKEKASNWQERMDSLKNQIIQASNAIKEGAEKYKEAEIEAIEVMERQETSSEVIILETVKNV